MRNFYLRLAATTFVTLSLFTAHAVYAGTPTEPFSITNFMDNTVDSIASKYGFSSSSVVSRASGGYKYNGRHQGMNAQHRRDDGSLLTIDYCQNGAYVATIQTPCTSEPNACGMTGNGFVTKIVSNERQVTNTTSACSAQKPADSLCSSGQNVGQTGSNSANANTCIQTNICSSEGSVVNSCTGALVQACRYGCADGRCLNECTPHYFCKDDNLYWGDTSYSYCSASVSQVCQWGCSNNACNPAPSAKFDAFTFTGESGSAFPTDGSLTARPLLVQKGRTTQLYWNVINVKPGSCSVSGNGNDTFTGVDAGSIPRTSNYSGTNGVKTSPIMGQTIYTLNCIGFDDMQFSTSTTINTIPVFEEL